MTQNTDELNLKQFSSQIVGLMHLLKQFSDILDQESDIIKKNQADQLVQITQSKQDLAEQINSLTNELDQTLANQNLNLISLVNSRSFTLLSEEQQSEVKQTILLVQQCHDKNLANGMSIQMLSNINKHTLDLISGKQQQDVKLYGSSGERTTVGSQSTLGKA
ncbi:MAG: flagellar protein FlgN [Pseudomonadota bacterium]|nr:flagellar protein FlgN [Pseudomonadota bacterium]